jgi:hypothetical protein
MSKHGLLNQVSGGYLQNLHNIPLSLLRTVPFSDFLGDEYTKKNGRNEGSVFCVITGLICGSGQRQKIRAEF